MEAWTTLIAGACTWSSDCLNGRACVGGTCCVFSTYDANPPSYYSPSSSQGYSNCTSCNSLNGGQCGACAPGYQLESQYNHGHGWSSGNMVCRQVCDPATEYRRSSTDVLCTKKLGPGSSCNSYGTASSNASCLSGLCGGGACCNAAAAAAGCTKGCENSWHVTPGMCTNKSIAGETCQTSSDCFGGKACVGGTCCVFSTYDANPPSYYSPSSSQGYSNCTSCNSLNGGQCGACAPGYQLESQYNYGPWSSSGNMICRQVCDPATEYRRSSSDVLCTKKLAPGSYCDSSDMCASGLCGGGTCCDQTAVASGCSKGCEPVSGSCTTKSVGAGAKLNSVDPWVERRLVSYCLKYRILNGYKFAFQIQLLAATNRARGRRARRATIASSEERASVDAAVSSPRMRYRSRLIPTVRRAAPAMARAVLAVQDTSSRHETLPRGLLFPDTRAAATFVAKSAIQQQSIAGPRMMYSARRNRRPERRAMHMLQACGTARPIQMCIPMRNVFLDCAAAHPISARESASVATPPPLRRAVRRRDAKPSPGRARPLTRSNCST